MKCYLYISLKNYQRRLENTSINYSCPYPFFLTAELWKAGWQREISIAWKFDTHQTLHQTHTGSQANSSRNRQKQAERKSRARHGHHRQEATLTAGRHTTVQVSHSLSHLFSVNQHERATFDSKSDAALLSIRINSPLHGILMIAKFAVTKCFTFAFSTMNLVSLVALSTGLSHA